MKRKRYVTPHGLPVPEGITPLSLAYRTCPVCGESVHCTLVNPERGEKTTIVDHGPEKGQLCQGSGLKVR